jgi:superfamily I DNA/RNA helicase
VGLKTAESLIKILNKVEQTLENKKYKINISKFLNQENWVYRVIAVKDEKKVQIDIYLRIDGNKTIRILNKEDQFLLREFEIKECKNSSLKIEANLVKKNNFFNRLEELSELGIILLDMKKQDNIFYRAKDPNENYTVGITLYKNGNVFLQGTESEFFKNLIKFLLNGDKEIISTKEKYKKNLQKILEDKYDNKFQLFLAKRAYPPTEEQLKVIHSKENLIVVNAVAGSGKTTTLEGLTAYWEKSNILYIVYNKKMREEADERFSGYTNIKIVTGHGLAYKDYSRKSPESNFDFFKIKKEMGWNIVDTVFTIKVLNLYLMSRKLSIREFVGEEENKKQINKLQEKIYLKTFVANLNRRTEFRDKKIIVEAEDSFERVIKANKLEQEWEKFRSESDIKLSKKIKELDEAIKMGKIPETHDYYLKQFQLDRKQIMKYDIVMLDEAQDANEVMLDIMEYKFPNARKIIVGDSHQQIYEWRGAKNAMEYFSKLPGVCLLNLSESYRVSSVLAKECNKLIALKGITLNMDGKNEKQKKKGLIHILSESDINLTILYRKNLNMLLKAIRSEEKIAFLKDLNVEKFIDIKYLAENRKEKIKYLWKLKRYKNIEMLKKYITNQWEEDPDIILSLRLFEIFPADIEQRIKALKERVVPFEDFRQKEKKGIITLGTIHSSKGYEFDRLLINSDILSFVDRLEKMTWNEVEQEINLIYVALTRSSREVYYGFTIEDLKRIIFGDVLQKGEIPVTEEDTRGLIKNKQELNTYMLARIIEERGIKELFHFTKKVNLKSILKNGIYSVNYLEKNDIKYIKNDYQRLDDCYNFISLSVSFPNYKMLYQVEKKSSDSYVILSIDPKILLHKKCLFFSTNAANRKVRERDEEPSNFSCFEEMFEYSLREIPKNYPTDPQAEILVEEEIEPEFIRCVYINEKEFLSDEKRWKRTIEGGWPNAPHIKFRCVQKYFEPREW